MKLHDLDLPPLPVKRAAPTPKAKPRRPRMLYVTPLRHRLMEFLRAGPKTRREVDAIFPGKNSGSLLRSALKAGLILQVEHGVWALPKQPLGRPVAEIRADFIAPVSAKPDDLVHSTRAAVRRGDYLQWDDGLRGLQGLVVGDLIAVRRPDGEEHLGQVVAAIGGGVWSYRVFSQLRESATDTKNDIVHTVPGSVVRRVLGFYRILKSLPKADRDQLRAAVKNKKLPNNTNTSTANNEGITSC